MPAPLKMRCTHCYREVTRNYSDTTFWCTCGRHWPAPRETSENDDSEVKTVVEVPEVEKEDKNKAGGRIKRNTAYTFENRTLYLHRNKLTEAEILQDEEGNEYWLKDNFQSGTTEKVMLPARYKNQKNR